MARHQHPCPRHLAFLLRPLWAPRMEPHDEAQDGPHYDPRLPTSVLPVPEEDALSGSAGRVRWAVFVHTAA